MANDRQRVKYPIDVWSNDKSGGGTVMCPGLEEIEVLAREPAAALSAHMSSCANCRARLVEIRENLSFMRRVARPDHDHPTLTRLSPAPSVAPGPPARRAEPSDPAIRFPGYSIVSELSRGGQGIVYLARQLSTGRTVALKVLRSGPGAAAADRARFEREVQVLAQLQHPHIVAIHDSGSAGDDAYFVMDYIEGVSLDQYAQQLRAKLGLQSAAAGAATGTRACWRAYFREMLQLFVRVCDAVQAAHVRGVIHRDLKPSNIRVGPDGAPKVLDFGLAKLLTDAGGGEAVAMTMSGQFLGSLPWSTPEQAQGAASRIDTRTDVYALGVVLYQLLTERFPYDVTGGLRNILERICHATPQRPARLCRYIDADLETVVLKALSKEQEQRYQSAGELAGDLRRCLAHEPITARRETLWYLVQTFIRRRPAVAILSGTIALLVVAMLATVTVLLLQVDDARRYAEMKERRAVAQADRADEVSDLIRNLLMRIDPIFAETLDTRLLRGLVDDAARDLRENEPEVPVVAATMHHVLGDVYLKLRDDQAAALHLNRALGLVPPTGEDSAARPTILASIGDLRFIEQRWAESEQAFRDALALAAQRTDVPPKAVLRMQHGLATVLSQQRKHAEAVELYGQVLAARGELLGADARDTLDTRAYLAQALVRMEKFSEAEALLSVAVEAAERELDAHPRYIVVLNVWAQVLSWRGNLSELARVQQRVASASEAVYPEKHPAILFARSDLAWTLFGLDRVDEAIELMRATVALRREVQGPNRQGTLISCYKLAEMLIERGVFAEAEELLNDTIARADSDEKTKSTATAARDVLSELYLRTGRCAEALRLSTDVVAKRGGGGLARIAAFGSRNRLGRIFLASGDAIAAERELRKAFEESSAAQPDGHWETAVYQRDLGICLFREGRNAEAISALQGALAVLEGQLGATHRATQLTLHTLERAVRDAGDIAQADKYAGQLVTPATEFNPCPHALEKSAIQPSTREEKG